MVTSGLMGLAIQWRLFPYKGITIRRLRRSCSPWPVVAPLLIAVAAMGGCKRPSTPSTTGSPPADSTADSAQPAQSRPLNPELSRIFRLIQERKTGPARVQLVKYMKTHARDGQAVFLFGLTYHREKRYAQAREHFDRAIELDPNYALTYYFRAWALYYLGELDASRASFLTHLGYQPDEPDTVFGLGLIALDQGDLDEAQRRFERAIELQEDDAAHARDLAKAHARLGDVLIERGELERARVELQRAVELFPDHYEAYYKLSRVLFRLGEPELAEAALERAPSRQAARPSGHRFSGVIDEMTPALRRLRLLLVSCLAILLNGGCDRVEPAPNAVGVAPSTRDVVVKTSAPSIHFADVTDRSGISMITTNGEQPSTQILEVNGGGLALIDYDEDGDLDLFIANGATMTDPESGPGSRLFENLGSLQFRDVTESTGIDLRRWAMGVAVGDYDADGHDDLYVTCYGPNVLLRNLGDGRFEDVTESAGVGDERWGTSAAFGDLDNDGDLDLYVVNYLQFDHANPPRGATYKGIPVMAGPHGLPAQHDVLYENLGNGRFRDITEASGCLPDEPAFGLNVAILDFDQDGRQDIFVANDSMANFLFRNLGDLRFESRGMISGIAGNYDGSMQATMGIAIGDLDGNGYPDVFTTNFSSDTNTVHLNLEGKFFDDRTKTYGLGMISRAFLGWSCGLYDFDHDGDEDLLLFNGHVYPEATLETMDSEYQQTPLLFAREGPRFELVGPEVAGSWLGETHRDRSAVFADLDGDGDIDVIVTELNGPVRVLENLASGGAWVNVRLVDDRPGVGNRHGLGSRIELSAGDRRLTRWLFSGGGFQSSGAPSVHFALPEPVADATIEVTWPDGYRQQVKPVRWGERQVVTRDG